MTRFRVLLGSLLVLAMLACIPAQSQAFDFGFGNCNMYGFRSASNLYSLGHIPTPPYFAIHPPVYYGQRYFRSYGESPYARPARSSRPLLVDVQLIKNPFYQGAMMWPSEPLIEQDTSQEVKQEDQVAAQVIINPYYQTEAVVQK